MARAFKPEHRPDFWAMIRTHFEAVCRTTEGKTYSAMGSMLSGAWCTTDANTVLNAFVRYGGLRLGGITRDLAWELIGCVFGDDSIGLSLPGELPLNRGEVSPDEAVVQFASQLGLSLEVVHRPRVFAYLSRYFVIDRGNVCSSIVDMARMFGKFTFMPRSADQYDWQCKFSSLLDLVGHHTPIFSVYLRKWLRFNGLEKLGHSETRFHSESAYWTTLVEEWSAFPPPDEELIDFAMERLAESRGVDVAALFQLQRAIGDASTVEELTSSFLYTDPKPVPTKFGLVRTMGNVETPVKLSDPRVRTVTRLPCGSMVLPPLPRLADQPAVEDAAE